jgi:ribosomal protein S12 methylthiotransferase accessory factor YcaO
MESIERYSSEFRDEYGDRLIRGSYKVLKKKFNVLGPRLMILSKISDYDHDKDIHWVQGSDLPTPRTQRPFRRLQKISQDDRKDGIELVLHPSAWGAFT